MSKYRYNHNTMVVPKETTLPAKRKREKRPSTIQIWLTAARPHTLTASLSPCIVAYASCRPPAHLFAAWVLFCLTVQLGTNLHNDYADFVKGADTNDRVGHARATAKGWLTPAQTCAAATATLSVTLAAGIYLVNAVDQWHNPFLWFLVVSSVFNAFAYTAGPYPLGYLGLSERSIAYAGLGDAFVFLYFGLVATLMLPYLMFLQNQQHDETYAAVANIDWSKQFMYASQVGLLATNIIVVNNLRDRHTDISAGKRTTAVRFGRPFSVAQYILNNLIVSSLTVYDFVRDDYDFVRLLPLIIQPLVQKETTAIFEKDGDALNPHVGGAAKVQLAFCVLLSIGLLFTRYEDAVYNEATISL